MSSCAASAGERDVSRSAFAPRIQRRSTGSDCKSLYCLPTHCLCGSTLRTSDTGSPNTRYLCSSRSPRTKEPQRPLRDLPLQEQWQPPKSSGSYVNLHAGVSNNTKEAVVISMNRSDSGRCGRYVRFGSKADILRRPRHVRFTPGSRHVQCTNRRRYASFMSPSPARPFGP